MGRKKCNFECEKLEDGECLEQGGDCIGDLCEEWRNCGSCTRKEDCENVRA